ncbi:MAG: DUF3617 family protein [Deltaproteobacteria bacterium]|nr:DUF3617 family protein [Deltaproteobacteria bacterium]
MPRVCKSVFVLSILFLSACSGSSDSLSIKPGEWEITTSSAISILPHAVSHTETKCLSSKELGPSVLMEESMNCTYSGFKREGSELSWEMSCAKESETLEGTGSLTTADKENFSGGIKIMFPSADTPMSIGKNWKASYVGPCK